MLAFDIKPTPFHFGLLLNITNHCGLGSPKSMRKLRGFLPCVETLFVSLSIPAMASNMAPVNSRLGSRGANADRNGISAEWISADRLQKSALY